MSIIAYPKGLLSDILFRMLIYHVSVTIARLLYSFMSKWDQSRYRSSPAERRPYYATTFGQFRDSSRNSLSAPHNTPFFLTLCCNLGEHSYNLLFSLHLKNGVRCVNVKNEGVFLHLSITTYVFYLLGRQIINNL